MPARSIAATTSAPSGVEPAVVVLAAAAEQIVSVVRDRHPTDAEGFEFEQPLRVRAQAIPAFDVEDDAEPSGRARSVDVRDRMHERILIAVRGEPRAERAQHAQRLVEFDGAEAGIDRHHRYSRTPVPRELRQEARIVGTQRQAYMVVPQEPVSRCAAERQPGGVQCGRIDAGIDQGRRHRPFGNQGDGQFREGGGGLYAVASLSREPEKSRRIAVEAGDRRAVGGECPQAGPGLDDTRNGDASRRFDAVDRDRDAEIVRLDIARWAWRFIGRRQQQ